MQIKVNPQKPNPKIIEQATAVLKQGGILIYPTDTIYGLGCDIYSQKAINKIYQLKKREKRKPFSIICADLKEVAKYALIGDYAYRLMKKLLPGPYTFVLKAKSEVPQTFLPKNKTVGIRIPASPICLALVKELGNPFITTSLNISGQKVMTSPGQLTKEMRNKVDLILDAGNLGDAPSTIIDLTTDYPVVIREGRGDLNFLKNLL